MPTRASAPPEPQLEDSIRVTRAYDELQGTKYYMYGIAGVGIVSFMMALKSLLMLVRVSNSSTVDPTMVDFLELVLVAVLFFEIGFIAKAAQIDSFENVRHQQFGTDCALGFVSLVLFLLDNFIRARVLNSVLELLWTAPYTYRAVLAVRKSYNSGKEAEATKVASGGSFAIPKVSTASMATAVIGRLAKI
jgi:hypothetical protein